MPAYTFKCPAPGCGAEEFIKQSMHAVLSAPKCGAHDTEMVRNYQVDIPGLALSELRKTSSHEYSDDLFLPDAKRDFSGPTDPDGSKGMKTWLDTHVPAEGNKNPKWPKMPTGSKAVL